MTRHTACATASALLAGVLLATMAGCARSISVGAAPRQDGAGTPVEIFVVPAPVPNEDGTLYQRTIGTPAAGSVAIARGTDATFIGATGAGADGHLQWYSSSSGTLNYSRPGVTNASGSSEPLNGASTPLTSLDIGDVHYAQVNGDVVATIAGQTTATYSLPSLAPDPGTGGLPRGYKGVYSGTGPGQVTSLLPTTAGHVLAFTSTGRASAVTDLMTGRSVSIRGYGTLGNAVRTPSGHIVVLAWRGFDDAFTMRVVTLDGATLSVTSAANTGLAPDNYLRDRVMVGAGHDAVVSVAHGTEETGVTLSVYTVDNGRITARPQLPLNAGLEIAPAGGNSVYVFNGPAANKVGELNLAHGVFTRDVPALRSPAGSYVVGVYTP